MSIDSTNSMNISESATAQLSDIQAPLQVDQKTLDDYYAFFTGKEVDMLPYVYAESSEAYRDLVKNSPDYYLFRDEVSIIANNKDKLSNYLADVVGIVEVGPGFDYTISRKTIPFLSYAQNLRRYYAIDNSTNYLRNACDFIKSHTTSFEVHPIAADLMNGVIDIPVSVGKKCIVSFGVTLGNFDHLQQKQMIRQLNYIARSGDLLVLTTDTNRDEASAIKAYTGDFFTNFALCALTHFAKINPSFEKYALSFETECFWNSEENSVDRYYIAKKAISFDYYNYGNIFIPRGQRLKGIMSRKLSLEHMTKLLEDDFDVVDILSHSDKVKTFVCKKI